MINHLRINPKVLAALNDKRAVVALESTIICHGMPYPENLKTALECEKIIEEKGATPATIAIINGEMVVGLTHEEIDYLARNGSSIRKVARPDLLYTLAMKLDGATTVSSTMLIASLAGIKFFATGGIGGVHRGAETSFDISADLEELSMTPVCVISAGAKAILDLGKTLEYLETKGVPVIGYQTSVFPNFYTPKSEYSLNIRVELPSDIAKIIKIQEELKIKSGILVANPIPSAYSMNEEEIKMAIDEAIDELNKQGIKGKDTTPFLLKKVKDLTKGESLASNIQLVYNNCRLASEIAIEYAKNLE